MVATNLKKWKDQLNADDLVLVVSRFYGCGLCPAQNRCPVKDCGDVMGCEKFLRSWVYEGVKRGRPPK